MEAERDPKHLGSQPVFRRPTVSSAGWEGWGPGRQVPPAGREAGGSGKRSGRGPERTGQVSPWGQRGERRLEGSPAPGGPGPLPRGLRAGLGSVQQVPAPVGEGRAAVPASQRLGGEHIAAAGLCSVRRSPRPLVWSGSCILLVCILNGNMQEGKGSCHCTPKGLRICKSVPSLPPPLGSPASPVTVASRDSHLLSRGLKTEASGRKCVACSKCHGQEVAGPDLNPVLLLFAS